MLRHSDGVRIEFVQLEPFNKISVERLSGDQVRYPMSNDADSI